MEPTKLKPTDWLNVFESSRVIANAPMYSDEELPRTPWPKPKESWLRTRLAYVRAQEVERE